MSVITLILPKILSKSVGGENRISISASTLGQALDQVKELHRDLADKLFDPTGEPKRLLNFFINGKNARLLGFLDAELVNGDEVLIIPGVSGG